MRIVIRADAGTVPETGTGHVVRAISLANALYQTEIFKYSEILFATRGCSPYEIGRQLVEQAGYKIITTSMLEPNSELEQLNLINLNPDIVILDRLDTTEELILALKKHGIFVVTFDDLGMGRKHSDLAINALLQEVEPDENVYIGYKYLFPLTNVIAQASVNRIASRVFVSFGGFDYRELSAYFINTIPDISGPQQYEIVVGDLDAKINNDLLDLAKNTGNRADVKITVHQRPSNYYELLGNSDLAIVSGGLTVFDCVRVGIPVIGIPQYEHQLENLHRLEKAGCLVMGAHDMGLDKFLLANAVTELCTDYEKRKKMSQSGMKLVDGKGLDRTIALIANMYQ